MHQNFQNSACFFDLQGFLTRSGHELGDYVIPQSGSDPRLGIQKPKNKVGGPHCLSEMEHAF